jgi:hypothetical protein
MLMLSVTDIYIRLRGSNFYAFGAIVEKYLTNYTVQYLLCGSMLHHAAPALASDPHNIVRKTLHSIF